MNFVKEFVKRINSVSHKNPYETFNDFLECSFIALNQTILLDQENENRFLQIESQYKDKTILSDCFGIILQALEQSPRDFLGEVFHELELHNKYSGQFFTPYNLSKAIAKISVDKDEIDRKHFITVSEPACGSGGMLIAFCDVLKEKKINYQQKVIALAQDVDIKCIRMAFIQCTLLGIPTLIRHGNTLSNETYQDYPTLFFLRNNGYYRLNHPEAAMKKLPVKALLNNGKTVQLDDFEWVYTLWEMRGEYQRHLMMGRNTEAIKLKQEREQLLSDKMQEHDIKKLFFNINSGTITPIAIPRTRQRIKVTNSPRERKRF